MRALIKNVQNRILALFFFALLFCGIQSRKVYAIEESNFLASSVYQNEETGYTAYLDDEESLLSDEEKNLLTEKLKSLTKYGNVAFLSGRGEESAADTIRDFYDSVFYGKSGLIFFIDMENRQIRIQSGGDFYKTITRDVANSITDNVYVFASRGEYYKTAAIAFSQVEGKMEGRFLATPMRWICNLFLAVFLGLFLNFAFLLLTWKQRKAGSKAVLGVLHPDIHVENPRILMTNRVKTRLSSGSGRSGGFSSGGGGHSSGGGGHSF